MVNVVSEGVANAKAAAHSAADAINENVDTLKDKACKLILTIEIIIFMGLVFLSAETLKAGQKVAENAKATAGKKLDEAKKKASGSVEDL